MPREYPAATSSSHWSQPNRMNLKLAHVGKHLSVTADTRPENRASPSIRPSTTPRTPSRHSRPKLPRHVSFRRSRSAKNTCRSGCRAMLRARLIAVSVFPQLGEGDVTARVFQPFRSIDRKTSVRNRSKGRERGSFPSKANIRWDRRYPKSSSTSGICSLLSWTSPRCLASCR